MAVTQNDYQAAALKKSRRSNPSGNCVLAGLTPDTGTVVVGDTKAPHHGAALALAPGQWAGFARQLKTGQLV